MTRAVLRAASASAIPLAVAAAAFTVAVGLPAGDPDMWWHLATGRWIVEHGRLLNVDVFSSTATGEPYALGEPLGEVILWLAYAAGSWVGVAVLRAALVALAAFSVTRLALRGAPARAAVPLAAVALVLSKPTWTDRPQLWTLALLPLVLDLALRARDGSRASRIAVVPIVALWAVLHGGYAIGVGVLWIFAAEALITRRPFIAPALAAFAATAVVPFEPGALPIARAIAHVGGSTVRIVEETPVDPLTPFGALFALFAATVVAALMLRTGPLLAALVIVPTLWLALSAQRQIPLFAFAAVPFVAGPLAELVRAAWRALLGAGTTRRRGERDRAWRVDGAPVAGSESGGISGEAEVARYRSDAERYQVDASRHQIDAERHQIGTEPRTSAEEPPLPGSGHEASSGQPGAEDVATGSSPSSGSHPLAVRPIASKSYPFAQGRTPSRSYPSALAPAFAALLWLGAFASIATADPRPDLAPYPAAALGALRSSSGVVLNEYDWGGWLIWNAPDRLDFVDGRLYPFTSIGVMDAYRRALAALPGWRGVIDRWGVRQALLRPDRALVQALRDEGWRTLAEDRTFVLLERPR